MKPRRWPPATAPVATADEVTTASSLTLGLGATRRWPQPLVDGRQWLTLRVYPDLRDSIGVSLFARGGSARFSRIEAWNIECVWPELG